MTSQNVRTVLTFTAVALATLATVTATVTATVAQEARGPMFPFDTVDADKDGKVTKAELDAYRATRTAAIDANADGKLSVEELTAMHLARLTEQARAMASKMVEDRDTDGDVALSAAELASRPMPVNLFDTVDADDDGAVTEAEIAAMRAEMAERKSGNHGKDGRGKPGHGRFWDMMGSD